MTRRHTPACTVAMVLASSPVAARKTTPSAGAGSNTPSIPLYRGTLTGVMRPDVSVAQWPNDVPELRFGEIAERR